MTRYAKTGSRGRNGAEDRESPTLDPMINAYAWWLDHAGEFSNEAIRFVSRRLDKDLEAATQLMRCDDSNQALALQVRFANDLAADYLDEGKRVFELMVQAAAPGTNHRHTRRSD